ncbi:venom serine carboxypeptidase [Diachasma alloeum]|uniref:venom serine carboxypeptidase n=1 Tax=Diachasma alloeum TaxID=454923 RepID=UPI0007383DD9|nr:venom serine carboxypeptidase [Diachasma alloeum]
MGFTVLTSLVLSSIIATVYYSGYNLDITSGRDYEKVEGENDLHPLFLTPLIESGSIDEARRKSIVEHEGLRDLVSYSGFFTVNKEYNSNLFFWFFPAQMISKTAPIVIWLQGGPGESSLLGLFSENGPFRITKGQTLENREDSWAGPLNMLYIDSPMGTGYSFTDHDDGYADNQLSVGLYLYQALVQFFQLFPELRTNDLYIAGESFGGKFATALGYAIHALNPAVDNPMNLQGLAIFSGALDPVDKSAKAVEPPPSHVFQPNNFLDFKTITQFLKYERKMKGFIDKPNSIDLNDVFSMVSETTKFIADLPPLLTPEKTEKNSETNHSEVLSQFMEDQEVKHAIHVGNRTFVVNSDRVKEFLKVDMTRSLGNVFAILLENYRILIVNGELDAVAPAIDFERSLMNLNWGGKNDLRRATVKQWVVDGEVAGYVKRARKLATVKVQNSGGFVIKERSTWILDLIIKFTGGESIV